MVFHVFSAQIFPRLSLPLLADVWNLSNFVFCLIQEKPAIDGV